MNNRVAQLVGRRAAGTWGKPTKNYLKRLSAKGIRRLSKLVIKNESGE